MKEIAKAWYMQRNGPNQRREYQPIRPMMTTSSGCGSLQRTAADLDGGTAPGQFIGNLFVFKLVRLGDGCARSVQGMHSRHT